MLSILEKSKVERNNMDCHYITHLHAAPGAGLDVCTPEPLPGDHPLLQCPGVTVLPHIGSATSHARLGMANLAVDNVLAFLRGEKMPAAVAL